jgi:hypothetical protein
MRNLVTYNTEDKSEWKDGVWKDEPDKMSWTDEKTGLPCLIVRNNGGALCGYVGVEESHKLFGKDYNDEETWNLRAHGGITFTDSCSHSPDPARGICHIPEEGKSDNVWWFGFDCAHLHDLSPAYNHMHGWTMDETYRNVDYVVCEVENLALQLSEY